MFHTGAGMPEHFPHVEGTGDVARYLKVNDMLQARQLVTDGTARSQGRIR